MKVSFSLNKAKTTSTGVAPSLKQPAAFASLADDEPIDAAPTASSSKPSLASNRALAAQAAAPRIPKAQQKRIDAEKQVDASVYDYDEVWERMQDAKARLKELKEKESKERQPKYIGQLLHSATVRKLDHLRAEEKMIQRERETEGDEFADKEHFVTQAYKDQMAEVRRAEEEEKKREEMEKSKRKSTGLSHFYQQMLNQQEQEHKATVDATQKRKPLGPENLTITKPEEMADHMPVSDLERAKVAQAEGKEVELNDDNQIVDKRELLSAGLNLSAPNTRKLGLSTGKKAEDGSEPVITHRAVGTAATRQEINERRRREIETQLSQERERTAQEREEQERERTRRLIAKRNTEEDVTSARQRYLERKRRKLESSNAEMREDES